jgi:hypothetical protein
MVSDSFREVGLLNRPFEQRELCSVICANTALRHLVAALARGSVND